MMMIYFLTNLFYSVGVKQIPLTLLEIIFLVLSNPCLASICYWHHCEWPKKTFHVVNVWPQ